MMERDVEGHVVVTNLMKSGTALEHRLLRIGDGKIFDLSNRPFTTINSVFESLPAKVLSSLGAGRNPVNILDLGGGSDSVAAHQIAREYAAATVYNADLLAESQNEQPRVIALKQGGPKLDLPDTCIKLALSYQFLVYFHLAEEMEFIREIVRVLEPGGVAFLDEENIISLPQEQCKKICEELLVSLTVRRKVFPVEFSMAMIESGTLDFHMFLNKYLLIAKQPLNPVIERMIRYGSNQRRRF